MALNQNVLQKQILPTHQDSPGSLRSEVSLTIQTREAQKLLEGRRAEVTNPTDTKARQIESIIGLTSFGRRMSALWVAAQYDDPYADWYLLQIELALNEAKNVIGGRAKELSSLLASMDAVKIKSSHSVSPIEIPLNFGNPYGYQGAYLIADFDALVCSVMTAWHIGLLDRSLRRTIVSAAGKQIRRAFLLPTRWRFTGVTRSLIRTGDPVVQQAQARMGELPQDVLDLKRRAKIAPEIRSASVFILPTKEIGAEEGG